MFKNHLRIVFRSFRKYKSYSLINVIGLALGLTACILILLFIENELSYNRFHKNANRIFRVNSIFRFDDNQIYSASSPMPLGNYLEQTVPEVAAATTIRQLGSAAVLRTEEKRDFEDQICFADEKFLSIFDFKLQAGNRRTALQEPYSMVLTHEIAQKYFGDRNPVQQLLTMKWDDTTAVFKVTGVLDDVPANSSLRFKLVASVKSITATTAKREANNWLNIAANTFVLLRDAAHEMAVDEKIKKIVNEHTGKYAFYTPFLQPLTDIHLNQRKTGIAAESDIRYVYIYGSLALLILFIAAINYANLASAVAMTRSQEVGLRKVLGARRPQLIRQFISEAILYCLLALFISFSLVEMLLPLFRSIVQRRIDFTPMDNPVLITILILVTLVAGIVSGTYPALFLSRYSPVKILRAHQQIKSSRSNIRKILVIVQFSATAVLLISTLVMHDQLDYLRNKKLGFDKENVIVIPLEEQSMKNSVATFKTKLAQIPAVMAGSMTGGIRKNPSRNGFRIESQNSNETQMIPVLPVEYEFKQVVHLNMAKGRWFRQGNESDELSSFIINETACRSFGWDDPIGKQVVRDGQTGEIIGVVKDFHFQPLHYKIEPLVLFVNHTSPFWTYSYSNVMIRIQPVHSRETISKIQSVWEEVFPDKPFHFSFLDDEVEMMYANEIRSGKLFIAFTLLSILTACLGLLGLAAFSTTQRTKEIGIRKVFGASVASIVGLLSKEFVTLVAIAMLIATPIAYIIMSRWLQDFAYRIYMSWWFFAIAGALALVIALLTVSVQSLKAALANPVEALRYE